jgi:hypothetical protein
VGELCGDTALCAKLIYGLQHRRWAAGVDGGAGGVVTLEHRREQVGDVAVMPGMTVVAREPDLAAGEEVVEAAGVPAVTESEQQTSRDGAIRESSAEERERGDPDPAADEDRPCGPGIEPPRLREAVAERPVDPDPLARLDLAEAVCSGADPLDQEVEAAPPVLLDRVGDRERPRQERALALPLPVVLGGEHVELARPRRRPGLVPERENAVPARVVRLEHLAKPPPERRGRIHHRLFFGPAGAEVAVVSEEVAE